MGPFGVAEDCYHDARSSQREAPAPQLQSRPPAGPQRRLMQVPEGPQKSTNRLRVEGFASEGRFLDEIQRAKARAGRRIVRDSGELVERAPFPGIWLARGPHRKPDWPFHNRLQGPSGTWPRAGPLQTKTETTATKARSNMGPETANRAGMACSICPVSPREGSSAESPAPFPASTG